MIARPIDPLTYTVSPLDRAGILRTDAAAVQTMFTSDTARFVPIWKQQHLINADGTAGIFSYGEVAPHLDDAAETVFLGLDGETPWFAVGFPPREAPPLPGDYRALNDVVLLMPGDQAAILAYARAVVIWNANHRHCGRCGSETLSAESGHCRVCINTACAHRTFPRTDPVVITLITDGERCLLGRQASWAPGVYSTIAGFVEPGETVEAAVRREAEEETGIEVGEVRYIASQPWPFPASLMFGFHADALTTTIRRKDNELEDCRWFTRADILAFTERTTPEPGFKLPNRYAIARLLLDRWLR
ncbi:MAG: NAD(+) diphosphatase [Rhodospirillaceae bacterium]